MTLTTTRCWPTSPHGKYVEATSWSRAKGIAGMDIQGVTVAHLSRRGMDEFGLRGLPRGRFTGLILTRNVAETVYLSQLQKRFYRAKGISSSPAKV